MLQRPPTERVRDLVALPRTRFLITVVATGLIGGAIGAVFLGILHGVDLLLGPEHWSRPAHLAVLAGVGVAITVLTKVLGRPANVELLVDNIHVTGGTDSLRSLRSLLPISLLCVGSGGTLGPEAPLVTTTGSMGSWIAARADLARRERRIVSIAGMAAGFTVLFGAPLGSTVFALEILHRRGLEYYEALLPSAIGSLCGYLVFVVVTGLGLEPVFAFPPLPDPTVAWLGWGVAAGVAGALIAIAFTHLVIGMTWLTDHLPSWTRPVLGGLVLGGMAFASPYALTNGELQIETMNGAHLAAVTLLVAAGVKLIAAAVTMAFGWKGGFIIPLFFVGYAVARAAAPHLPGADEWVLAAALMTAANVGVTKTPIGTALVITEMAGTVVLPSTLIAALVTLLLTSGVGLIESQRRRFEGDEDADFPAPVAEAAA